MTAAHDTRPLPTSKELGPLFTQLLGRSVRVDPGAAPLKPPRVACTYVTDQGAAVVICVFDLALAAYLGAALSMIPVAVANESVKSNTLSDSIADNLREVANVLAGSFNAEGFAHLRFQDLTLALKAVPPALSSAVSHASARVEVAVNVQGYGTGSLHVARVG